MTKEFLHDDPMPVSDLQACPWCQFVGTPRLFALHVETHEVKDTELRGGPNAAELEQMREKLEIAEAEVALVRAENKRLKVLLKERHKDYMKAITEQIRANIKLTDELQEANWILEGLRK